MDKVIHVDFSPSFRRNVVNMIKRAGGPMVNQKRLIEQGMHPRFVKALVKSIIKREGW